MTRTFLEAASFWTAALAVTFTAFAALFGLFAWYFSHSLSVIKDEESERFQKEATVRVAEANENSAKANERAALAEQRAAEANHKAEEERLARVKIEQRLADRFLHAEALKKELQTFTGQEFEVIAYWDDREARALYDRLVVELSIAGWKHIPLVEATYLFPGVTGVLVFVHPQANEATVSAAAALVSTLAKEGIVCEKRASEGPRTNRITINVGGKP